MIGSPWTPYRKWRRCARTESPGIYGAGVLELSPPVYIWNDAVYDSGSCGTSTPSAETNVGIQYTSDCCLTHHQKRLIVAENISWPFMLCFLCALMVMVARLGVDSHGISWPFVIVWERLIPIYRMIYGPQVSLKR